MVVEFFHKHRNMDSFNRYTVAVEVPTKEELVNFVANTLAEGPEPFELGLGLAKVHPKDQYNKAVGRDIATSRMVPVEFTFAGCAPVENKPEKTSYLFRAHIIANENDAYPTFINVFFSTMGTSDHVKLENVTVI